jgi:uncharacterized membrane protein
VVTAVACIAWAGWRAPWARLRENEQSHVFLGAIVATAVLWSIGTAIGPLPRLHLLGATLLYLMFGLPLAIVAMGAVAALATAFLPGEWLLAAPRALLGGTLPVLMSHAVLRFCERRLPSNFFVYVFGAAFFGGGMSMLAAGAATATAVAVLLPEVPLPHDSLVPVLLMLGFGEATLTGMLATLLAVYRPAWIHTFSDERYLHRR